MQGMIKEHGTNLRNYHWNLCGPLASFLIGGRHTAVSGPRGGEVPIVYIVDRFTGNVWFCGGIVCKQSGPITN